MTRLKKIHQGIEPVDLDAIQNATPDPQRDFDAWCAESDRGWEAQTAAWGEVD